MVIWKQKEGDKHEGHHPRRKNNFLVSSWLWVTGERKEPTTTTICWEGITRRMGIPLRDVEKTGRKAGLGGKYWVLFCMCWFWGKNQFEKTDSKKKEKLWSPIQHGIGTKTEDT